jgi:hypothetical protein
MIVPPCTRDLQIDIEFSLRGAIVEPFNGIADVATILRGGLHIINVHSEGFAGGVRLHFVARESRDRDPKHDSSRSGTLVMLNEVKHLGIAGEAAVASRPRTCPRADPSLALRMT